MGACCLFAPAAAVYPGVERVAVAPRVAAAGLVAEPALAPYPAAHCPVNCGSSDGVAARCWYCQDGVAAGWCCQVVVGAHTADSTASAPVACSLAAAPDAPAADSVDSAAVRRQQMADVAHYAFHDRSGACLDDCYRAPDGSCQACSDGSRAHFVRREHCRCLGRRHDCSGVFRLAIPGSAALLDAGHWGDSLQDCHRDSLHWPEVPRHDLWCSDCRCWEPADVRPEPERCGIRGSIHGHRVARPERRREGPPARFGPEEALPACSARCLARAPHD